MILPCTGLPVTSFLQTSNVLSPDINVAGKETFQLNEDNVREALYMSDVDPNEACLHALFSGPVLVVLFKMFDTDDRDFVS